MTKSRALSKAMKGIEELAQYSFKNMCLVHAPPYRSLYAGGAGIAYTFWKAACILDEAKWLDYARFWIDHVIAAPEDERIIKLPEKPMETVEIQVKDSLLFGNRGIDFVRALIAYAQDDRPILEKALENYTAPESKRLTQQEFLQGIAGRLVGCALLYRETGEASLKKYGDSIAKDLTATAEVSNGVVPWPNNHKLGFAHGRAGNYYALLLWSKETGYPLPEWVLTGLKQYAKSGRKHKYGISWPIDERDERGYMDSWCNGAPGLILLWTLAYNLYKDPLFLETARATGEYCIHKTNYHLGHLCCGAAGVSYALLSLNRIDPSGPWLEYAFHYADFAEHGSIIKLWRLGLYSGLAGIICLMLDLQNPKEAEQPVVEG